jgi:hypothetical protein
VIGQTRLALGRFLLDPANFIARVETWWGAGKDIATPWVLGFEGATLSWVEELWLRYEATCVYIRPLNLE